ncbi:MAG: 3-oxoacid CoA-transferase subunit B [Desulfobacteraceae bacterium]|nr:MAG: 3-oxoacid CoA-transferase subunit B [Desulfobacteraceae bacterium]
MSYKELIARRAALEIRSGQVINVGIGIPTLILEFLPADTVVFVHSENGILGMGGRCRRGSEDRNLIDAGGNYVTLQPGAAFFDSVLSFSLVRSGRLDIAFLGALEIAANGDLANWIIPGHYSPGIGGGMELAQKAKRVIVTTTHTTKAGLPKILPECTLPITAKACVGTIITELAVLDVTPNGLQVRELAAGTTIEKVKSRTAAPLIVPAGPMPVFS